MDLCGPMHLQCNSCYQYVMVDDYSRFTWTIFLKFTNETFDEFEALVKQVQYKINLQLATIQSNRGFDLIMLFSLSIVRIMVCLITFQPLERYNFNTK